MKKILLPTLFLLCFYISGISQTVLAVGDLSIIYYSDNPDEFGFVTFVDLIPGTLIYFDENGATNAGVLDSGEGILLYTVNSTITAGAIIPFQGAGVSGGGTWSGHTGTYAASSSGDQILIYQDTDGPGGSTPQTNPSFIAGFNAASTDKTDACLYTDSQQTDSPSVLTPVTFGDPPGTFLALGTGTGCQDENDHLYYNGTLNFPNIAAAKAAITDPDNWTGSAVTAPPADYNNAVAIIKANDLTLPVELNKFSGRALDKGNELEWSTASELNFSHFEIQRSTDGYEFATISEIQGQGNSTKTSLYSYTDIDFLSSQNYYRLRMVDFDQTIEFSQTILLKSNARGGLSIYPNPAKESIQLQFNSSIENAIYTVTTVNGQKVIEGQINGSNQDLDINALAKGIYILSVNGLEINETIKLIKE